MPDSIILSKPLDVPHALPEIDVLAVLREMGSRNRVMTSMIGLGYYGTHTPQVVLRKVLENPAWYTAYTPYQPEISQGRLEALLNFQTMVSDLTGLPIANASLLDEATAAAEAMTRRAARVEGRVEPVPGRRRRASRRRSGVIQTRAEPIGIEVVVADLSEGLPEGDFFGVPRAVPGRVGPRRDLRGVIEAAHERGAIVVRRRRHPRARRC